MIYMVYGEECGACKNVLQKIDEIGIRKYFNLISYQMLKPSDEVLNTSPHLSVPYFFTIENGKKKLLSSRLILDVLNKRAQERRSLPKENKIGFDKLFADIRQGLSFF